MALPFLPGNSFTDPTKTRFHVSHTFSYKNGYAQVYRPKFTVGGETLAFNQLSEAELDELANTKPNLTYGNATQPAPVEFVPAHVAFDKKVLLFNAFFKQTVHESPNEFYRVRDVKIYYYLEDDSISVVETPVENSGMPQGKLIKRQRLPKNDLGDFWHWKDFNIAINVTFYGKVFHIYDCDKWTAEYMKSEGIVMNQFEKVEPDPYLTSRYKPQHAYTTPSTYDKLKQFLEMDRKVLRFYCVLDDRDNMFGELRPNLIHYYLVDDTVEIREVHEPNDGRDPFPVLLGRQRLAKDPKNIPSNFPTISMETSTEEIKDWFSPADFMIGRTVTIMGNRFLIYDCDEFTKKFYEFNFGVKDFTPIQVTQLPSAPVAREIPPYNGFGSLEDSKQCCLSLIPQPQKKDVIKMLENDGKILRYSAIMDSSSPEDENRKFIISYRLYDDTITIFEPPLRYTHYICVNTDTFGMYMSYNRNSGIGGGRFLECIRVPKPGSLPDTPEYYKPQDFSVGCKIEVFKHQFIITGADEYVVKYMEARPNEFSTEVIESFKNKHKSQA